MSNADIILILRLVGAVMLLAAVVICAIAYHRRREASGPYLSLILLLLFNAFMLAASFVGERWPRLEMGLAIAAVLLVLIIFWLVWKDLRQHLRSVGLIQRSQDHRPSRRVDTDLN